MPLHGQERVGGRRPLNGGNFDCIRALFAEINGLAADTKLVLGSIIFIPDAELPISASVPVRRASVRGAGGPDYGDYYMKPIFAAHKTQGLHGYNGVDFGAPLGTPVFASAGGTVIIAKSSGWNGGYGEYVVVSHPNGTQTLYGHLSAVTVYEGQVIVRGELIGNVGTTGKSTGPHLHFEVRGARNPF